MTSSCDFMPPQDDEFSGLEELIQAAGGHVQASDDLRPRTIESASDREQTITSRTKLGGSALIVGLLLAVSFWTVRDIGEQASQRGTPTTDDIQQAALRYAGQSSTEIDWALMRVINEVRQSHARLIRSSLH